MEKILELIYSGDINAIKKEVVLSDLTVVDKQGDTALHFAVLKESSEIVNLLLQHNCVINVQNKNGKVPLHYAAELNLIEIAKSLLDSKGDLMVSDSYGNQPLWTAVFNAAKGDLNKLQIVELFLQHGTDKYHKNTAGLSPFDFANQVGFKPLVELLDKY